MELNREIAKKVLATVDAGLVRGMGNPVAGEMCVEAAVCFALGLPHSDEPPCVGAAVRALKINLNDQSWSSNEARAKGMRRIAIAQLGSVDIDQVVFATMVAEQVIRQIVPIGLRAAASVQKKQEHKDALEEAAKRCEDEGTKDAAADAANAANAAAAASYAASYAANAAYAADAAAAYAADAATTDRIFTLLADIATNALIKLGSQGAQWLDLCQ